MTSLLKRGLLAGWLVAVPAAMGANTNAAWTVDAWQSDDGLPNNNVPALAQTADGYLWVAAGSRPARFDGVRFEEFSLKDFAGGLRQKPTALLGVRDGLWIGFDHGALVHLNGQVAKVFTNGLPDRVTYTLTEDGEGSIWITYRSGTVYRLKGGQAKQFGREEGLPGGYVSSLAQDRRGKIWFARGGRLGVFRDGQFVTLTDLPGITARVAAAKAGGVWVCSGFNLAYCDEAGKLESRGKFGSPAADSEPTALLEDSKGGVWIGTSDSALFYFDGTGFTGIPTSHRAILSLCEDAEGNIWAGTDGGGLDRVHPRAVELETRETGLPFETVQSLCEDTNGTVWATTLNGLLIRRRGNGWETVSTNQNWPGGRPTCVAADRSGAVWIGTKDRALHCRTNGGYSTWRPAEGLAGHTIHALLASRAGDLWIGEEAPDVVQRCKNGVLETFQMPAGIRMIHAMTEDARGDIWVGSSRGYLLRISKGQVIDETARLGPELMSIRNLHATPDGSVWIGFADDGAGWIRDGRFAHFTAAQGFFEQKVSQIVSDNCGALWFGGDHGIFKASREDLLAVAEGKLGQARVVRYGPGVGLRSPQANFGDSPGSLRTRDGRLWIPTRTALAVVDPAKIAENSRPPRVLVKRLAVDDHVMAAYGGAMPVQNSMDRRTTEDGLRLPPAHRRLEFEFTALSFSAPENVRFRYRLEGFDDKWIEAGPQRSASYSRLPAGNYRFRVNACNGDGVWNETGDSLAFAVEPFFWNTWWFRSAAVLAAAGAVYYVAMRRMRARLQLVEQQAALDKERVRIARDLHDDLGTRLTRLVLLTGLVQRDTVVEEKREENLQKLSAMAKQVIKSLDETVWAVNPRNDTLAHLINYVGQFAVEFLQAAEIRCRPELPGHPPEGAVPARTRHNLFLTVKEALNNVVRHSRANEVRLRMTVDGDRLNLVIEDNGKGFGDCASGGEGEADGLRNMRHRMEELGGKFRIESAPGAGTRMFLECPWRG